MKHFIKGSQIFAFEDDGSQDSLITADMTPITQAEIDALRAAIPPAVPQTVTMRQARQALLQAGHIDTVNSAIAAMAGASGDFARIEWEYSQSVQRDRELVAAMGQILSLNAAQLDALFITADTL